MRAPSLGEYQNWFYNLAFESTYNLSNDGLREANSFRFVQVFKYFSLWYTDFHQEWVRQPSMDLRSNFI